MTRWILGRHGWLVPLVAFLVGLGGLLLLDRQRARELERARRDAALEAERRAERVAEEIGKVVSERIGALTAAKLRFASVGESVGAEEFYAALDSATAHLEGLAAISVIYPSGEVRRGAGAGFGLPGFGLAEDSVLAQAYRRALASGQASATGVLELPPGRRVVVFEPVVHGGGVGAVVAAELEPRGILRVALDAARVDTVRLPFFAFVGPGGVHIAGVPMPADWPVAESEVRVADTEWMVRLAYPGVGGGAYRVERVALWASGLVLLTALSVMLLLLRRTILLQREEIARRREAEEEASRRAREARRLAAEARALAVQLEAALQAGQKLSTSLDPNDVVELFLGSVAEVLEADVASLYTFEEEGQVVVGRKRMVFRDAGPTVRRAAEETERVRAPVSRFPLLEKAVTTGEPCVVEGDRGAAGAPASVTIPLRVSGHTVGVAQWESCGRPRSFDRGKIAFAQGLAAPAAAALQAADLFASLEAAREQAAREALRFATVLDQMADGVVIVDAEGRVELSNKAAAELLSPELNQLPLEEWASRYGITTVDGEPYAASDFPLCRACRGEHVRRVTFISRTSGGTDRYLSASAMPIQTPSGAVTGAAMVIRDVTDEHQYAEMLRHVNAELRRQAEELEAVNRVLREATEAKDQFLAVMSHELRTPINAIMGYTDLLDLEVKGTLNQDQKAMVGRIRETSKHLLNLINEVLDLRKIDAGQMELTFSRVDVGEVVDSAVQQMLPLATSKGLRLTVEPAESGTPVVVSADAMRLSQILLNLLSNAVKFTNEGGIRVRYGTGEDRVEIRVKDTGPGIPPSQRELIFEEFYQIESGLSRSSGGTGLGLAIARRIARLMGGDIRVESEYGAGSEFIVNLPLAGIQPGDGPSGKTAPVPAGP
ncbi:MAG TPA: ATP-binding protein [Longimicrobiales bacterium]